MGISSVNEHKAKIIAISISKERGQKKANIDEGFLKENYGLLGDAHAGEYKRQISLLPIESIRRIKSDELDLLPGDFAENITTEGLDFSKLFVGARMRLGNEAILEITQIGKECHNGCSISEKLGDCIMPKEGIFARVIKGGKITSCDKIEIVKLTEEISV